MLGYRKFKETNLYCKQYNFLTLSLTVTDTGDLPTIEPFDYRATTDVARLEWTDLCAKVPKRPLSSPSQGSSSLQTSNPHILYKQSPYSVVEKEALALILATGTFSVYLDSKTVTVYSDHSPLQFLHRMANHNQKLLRWTLEFQQYTLDIRHRPGSRNWIPDILSRPSLISLMYFYCGISCVIVRNHYSA